MAKFQRIALDYNYKQEAIKSVQRIGMSATLDALYPGVVGAKRRSKRRALYRWIEQEDFINARVENGSGRHRLDTRCPDVRC